MKILIALFVFAGSLPGFADERLADERLSELSNYLKYSETLASAGQPNSNHLKVLSELGVERVVYLAYTDNDTAIVSEDTKVLELGMDYIHIPVDYRKPTLANYQYMEAALQVSAEKNTLIHCQVNYRASVFSFLYRVIALGVPVRQAHDDLKSIWSPSGVWLDYMQDVAGHYDIDLNCDGCVWGDAD